MTDFAYNKVENIVGKGGNTGYQHFLLFQQNFPMSSYAGSKIKEFADDNLNAAKTAEFQ